jgi:hypothetical protein
VALVAATWAWYAMYGTVRVVFIATAWSLAATLCGAIFGAAGAHWRAGHVAPVALIAGALAGEALVLSAEWPRQVAATVLMAELALAGIIALALTLPSRALPAVIALTAVATIAMGVAADELRETARAAGWRGL